MGDQGASRLAPRWSTRLLLLLLFNFISAAPSMAFAAPQSPVTPTDSAIPTATSGSASTEETVPILVRFKPGVLRSEVDARSRPPAAHRCGNTPSSACVW